VIIGSLVRLDIRFQRQRFHLILQDFLSRLLTWECTIFVLQSDLFFYKLDFYLSTSEKKENELCRFFPREKKILFIAIWLFVRFIFLLK